MKKFFKHLVLSLLSLIGVLVIYGSIAYSPRYVYRVLASHDSDAFDWQKFPSHPLTASPALYHFASTPDPCVEELLTQLSGADDWDSFMETNGGLCSANEPIRTVLEISGFAWLIPSYSSLEEAKRSLAEKPKVV